MPHRLLAAVRCAASAAAVTALTAPFATAAGSPARHNVILFVPATLRATDVDKSAAPELDRLRRSGVAFPNSHAIVPTLTAANAAAIATGHLPGDTGAFADSSAAAGDGAAEPILDAARAAGYEAAAIGERDAAGTAPAQRLAALKATGKPFALVVGTAAASVRDVDDELHALRAALRGLGLEPSTDVIVASGHGSSIITRDGTTAPGFLARDIAGALSLPLRDDDTIGTDASQPAVTIVAGGGSDLIYLARDDAAALAPRVVTFLLGREYVSGVFVDARLGTFGGALPLTSIALEGAAAPQPAIAVSFSSSDTGCKVPRRCAVEVADTTLLPGQVSSGSFSAADIGNFIAAYGPDFKHGYVNTAPVSNADVGVTIAHLLGVQLTGPGRLIGRAFTEAMPGGAVPAVSHSEEWSSAGPGGVVTVLRYQTADGVRYVDVAGRTGRTVGL